MIKGELIVKINMIQYDAWINSYLVNGYWGFQINRRWQLRFQHLQRRPASNLYCWGSLRNHLHSWCHTICLRQPCSTVEGFLQRSWRSRQRSWACRRVPWNRWRRSQHWGSRPRRKCTWCRNSSRQHRRMELQWMRFFWQRCTNNRALVLRGKRWRGLPLTKEGWWSSFEFVIILWQIKHIRDINFISNYWPFLFSCPFFLPLIFRFRPFFAGLHPISLPYSRILRFNFMPIFYNFLMEAFHRFLNHFLL